MSVENKNSEHKRLLQNCKTCLDAAFVKPSDRVLAIASNKEGLWALDSNIPKEDALKFLSNIIKEMKKCQRKN